MLPPTQNACANYGNFNGHISLREGGDGGAPASKRRWGGSFQHRREKSQGPVGSVTSQRGPWDREKRFSPAGGVSRIERCYLRFTDLIELFWDPVSGKRNCCGLSWALAMPNFKSWWTEPKW